MIRPVWYLCVSDTIQYGLLFPNELEENYYSPGYFVITREQKAEKFSLKAVRDGEPIETVLVPDQELGDTPLYRVEVKGIGVFVFLARPLPPYERWVPAPEFSEYKYIGHFEPLKSHGHFWLLMPANEDFFEAACREKNFFFVGTTNESYERQG
jgi:hypothetical protein